MNQSEKNRRWQLVLGQDESDSAQALGAADMRLAQALSALYHPDDGMAKRGGLGRSAPRVASWLGDIREFFPSSMVQVIQQDAFSRLGLKEMLTEPEFLAAMQADVHLVADLISLRSAMPDKAMATARIVVQKVIDELMEKLAKKTHEAVRAATASRSKRTFRPRFSDVDWHRTISANFRHYQADYQTVIPEKMIGYLRQNRRLADLDEVVLCVDQSGSMAVSVVYSSIFAAVMASIPAVATKLVCFDTAVVDLSDELQDPVSVLFGVQLGGGTDINQAIAYCEQKIERPSKTHLILISDLCEGGNGDELLLRVARLIRQGVNVITLLALSDEGRPYYDGRMAQKFAALGAPVFSCTPDQFPDLMAVALKREDIHAWAAQESIKTIRGDEAPVLG